MKKKVIVYVDGGICSQICQYMHGYFLKENGFHVEYDLAWYLLDGHDLNGEKNRKFDLKRLCPDIKIKKANIIKSFIYRKYFSYKYELIQEDLLKNRNYLGGYYNLLSQQFARIRDIIHMNPKLDEFNQVFKERILTCEDSVCVHVRRGDMVKEGYYWKVLSPNYYIELINKNRNKTFFFFSDDMNWVKKEIINNIRNIKYELVEHNKDSQGYLDLFLMSYCKNFICSSGSLGKIAALLSPFDDKKVYLSEGTQDFWYEALQQYIVEE